MLKKDITYTSFDGKQVTETHYFHLGIRDIIELEETYPQGLEKWIKEEVDTGETKRILGVLGVFIDKGYGRRVGDGGFEKSKQISDEFAHTLAFDAFFNEMMMNQSEAVQFVLGMLPAELLARADVVKGLKEAGFSDGAISDGQQTVVQLPAEVPPEPQLERQGLEDIEDISDFDRMREDMLSGLRRPRDAKGALLPWALREPTRKELQAMTREQNADVMRRKNDPEWEPAVGG